MWSTNKVVVVVVVVVSRAGDECSIIAHNSVIKPIDLLMQSKFRHLYKYVAHNSTILILTCVLTRR